MRYGTFSREFGPPLDYQPSHIDSHSSLHLAHLEDKIELIKNHSGLRSGCKNVEDGVATEMDHHEAHDVIDAMNFSNGQGKNKHKKMDGLHNKIDLSKTSGTRNKMNFSHKQIPAAPTLQEVKAAFRLERSPILSNDPNRLSKVAEFLRSYSDIISYNEEYGRTNLVEHSINTGQATPVKLKTRPINPSMEKQLKEQIEHWQRNDVIEPSSSPWSFPLVPIVKKKKIVDYRPSDSQTSRLQIRWCVDYRALNRMTKSDSFPLPSIEDNLAHLSTSRIFSTLDNVGAFHSIKVKKEDREKTAFSAGSYGLYQFKCLPFGLKNAPSCYSRLIKMVMEGIPPSVALVFLDDVIVHSKDPDQHLEDLRTVFEAYRQAGLRLKPSKCYIMQTHVDYLGHVVSENGIEVMADYARIVKDWPVPNTLKTLRAFIGKVSYYRKFIKDFAAIAAPLTNVLSSDHPLHKQKTFELSDEAKAAFRQLKGRLLEAPILGYPQFNSTEPFILDTDWSGDPGAIGGVLSQKQDGKERVLLYGARKLNKTETAYSSNKGELLALLYFIQKWKYYLQFRPFLIRTDHQALSWLYSMSEPTGMVARWLQTLANYDFKVIHRPGLKHGNADALSRIEHAPGESERDPSVADTDVLNSIEPSGIALFPSLTSADLAQKQTDDDTLGQIRQWVKDKYTPSEEDLRPTSRDTQTYAALLPQLIINQHGLLVRQPERFEKIQTTRLCLPLDLVPQLINQYHRNGGHMGIHTTFNRIQGKYYCPNLIKEVELVIRQCQICQKKQGAKPTQKVLLKSVIDGYPFQRLSVDLVGPLVKSAKGNLYLFTMKDTFSRWLEAVPLSDITAPNLAEQIRSYVIARFGMPAQIHSDQGPQFTSDLMKELQSILRINCTTTPAYNPKSNPVERSHRDLKMILKALIEEDPEEDWEYHLPSALLAIRTARNRSTGFTPHFMLYGREAVLPVDLLYGNPPGPQRTPIEYVNEIRTNLQRGFRAARNQLQLTHERARQMYTNIDDRPLQVTDLVWLFTPRTDRRGKFSTYWTGPYEIIRKVNPVLFTLQSRWEAQKKEVTTTVGIDRIKRYYKNQNAEETSVPLNRKDVQEGDEFLESSQQEDEYLRPRRPVLVKSIDDEDVDIIREYAGNKGLDRPNRRIGNTQQPVSQPPKASTPNSHAQTPSLPSLPSSTGSTLASPSEESQLSLQWDSDPCMVPQDDDDEVLSSRGQKRIREANSTYDSAHLSETLSPSVTTHPYQLRSRKKSRKDEDD